MNKSPITKISDLDASFNVIPSIQALKFDLGEKRELAIDCLRLDQVHPFISGNKWYKLKYHILAAHSAGKSRILSFGGAYSNHLHALAFAGKKLHIKTIGIVRGEEPKVLSSTLQDCVDWGMSLYWLSRQEYRNVAPFDCIADYSKKYTDAWIIPEGGSSEQGVLGVRELFERMWSANNMNYDVIACPVGSGATLAGIVSANLGSVRCVGFSALKGVYDLESRVETHLGLAQNTNPWEISHDYHFGGFAKINKRLTSFVSDFHQNNGVLLDPVYTGKMFYGLLEWVYQGRIKSDARILAIHTGGLQGWRGFGDKVPSFV
jgi:1-aminocyclopropane-1-carboxylate deaminase/D-cysteine desulfhydrase